MGGNLKSGGTAKKENIITFDQGTYSNSGAGLHSTGYVYVPDSCKNGEKCKLHVAIHGCMQTIDDIGSKYVEQTGINDVAEANSIVVLYPQAKKSMFMPSNPNGCFDWWGYTEGMLPVMNHTYTTKKGVQMASIWNMVTALTGKSLNLEFLQQ
jgi:poly(3-hydroxybutyrate) depolymerase